MSEAPKAEEQFSNSNSAPETPVEEKKAHSINGNDPGNTPDPNSNSGSVPTTELDEKALFRRLSPSSRQALNEADGIRTALGQQEVHMEHLIAGLLLKALVRRSAGQSLLRGAASGFTGILAVFHSWA